MFSKFRVSKRSHDQSEEMPGLVLVSTSRVSETRERRWHQKPNFANGVDLIVIVSEDLSTIKNAPLV